MVLIRWLAMRMMIERYSDMFVSRLIRQSTRTHHKVLSWFIFEEVPFATKLPNYLRGTISNKFLPSCSYHELNA